MKTTLKKLAAIIVCAIIASASTPMSAQLTKEQIKERKELQKLSKKELNQKANKIARKEAKRMKKEGWNIAPGALPIEKQLDRCYMMQMEYGSDLFPSYIMAEGMSIGGNYDAAKMQALELAKINLASQIQSETAALIESSVANDQLDAEQAASITKTIMASKTLITQSIGRLIPVMEVYRTTSNRNKEVLVRVAYSEEMARAIALKAVKKSLAAEAEDLHDELDRIIDNKK